MKFTIASSAYLVRRGGGWLIKPTGKHWAISFRSASASSFNYVGFRTSFSPAGNRG